jgi:hypothetical protein
MAFSSASIESIFHGVAGSPGTSRRLRGLDDAGMCDSARGRLDAAR